MTKKESARSRFDSAYKALISNPRIFYQLIRFFVDEDFVKNLKPENIKQLEKSSFISPEFLQREADMIYRVELSGKEIYFYILLEFQSSPDKRIPVRLFSYLLLFYDQLIKHSQKGKLPAVFPMVLYNGEKPWNVPLSLQDLIEDSIIPASYIPHVRYYLLEERNVLDSKLEEVKNLAAAVIYFERHNREEEMIKTIRKIENLLADEDFSDIRQYLLWVFRISGESVSPDEIQKLRNKTEGQGMLETLGDRLMEKGRKEERERLLPHIVKSLLESHVDIKIVSKSTGLSEDEIKKIAKI
ncbi:MAG: Rpn family recombination-promoting nuclease/putative transposase [Spirochaetales bacterium]|nr:Rpn family recombination-promoting nuclease/putative transposase [Spirochaetales bacterium]